MYQQRFSQAMVIPKHNLKSAFLENGVLSKWTILIHRKMCDFKNVESMNKRLQWFIKNGKLFKIIRSTLEEMPNTYSTRNTSVLRVWAHQCECVVAQRLRRCQQMFSLYSKWWGEHALKDLLKRMKFTVSRRGKDYVLSIAGIAAYNWEENRIPDEELKTHLNEMEYVRVLREQTFCLSCENAQESKRNMHMCKCGTPDKLPTKSHDSWTPFVQQDDLLVWRRLKSSGQYEYKVYGNYSDVSAEDFLNVQIDTDYRRKWDTTAVMLEVAEKDEQSNSDILYWEMLWPRLFVNRDYVFNRRYVIDPDSKTIILMNKTTDHPAFPKYPEKYRVEEYWSCMVIKPYDDLRQPGLEFSLTYFDNPGVNIPSSVTTWVSMKAMPDFLGKLRNATRKYKDYCIREGTTEACRLIREEERQRRELAEKNKLDYCSVDRIRAKFEERLRRLEEAFLKNTQTQTPDDEDGSSGIEK